MYPHWEISLIYGSNIYLHPQLLSCTSDSTHLPTGYFHFDIPQGPEASKCQEWIQLLFFYKPAPNPTCLTSGSDMPIDFVAQPRNLGFSYEVFALGMPNFLPASNSPSLPLQKWSFKTANIIISRYSTLIPVFLPLHPPPSSNSPATTSGWIQSSYHALNFLSF